MIGIYRVIFIDETKINQFQSNGCTWCWMRDIKLQLQAHHVIQTIKHGGGAIFVCSCMIPLAWVTCARQMG